jgi:L-ascorbate metabolism protein UlaG (beta-lactamase superfamily)
MQITMIGHSSILIETAGKMILTDPFWNTWGNPAYARIDTPARSREQMTAMDAVLVSHDHWDHMDAKFFHQLCSTPVFAPLPASTSIRLMGVKKVTRVRPNSAFFIGEIKITVVPAVHVANTVGYILQSEGKTIYFAGDTFYSGFMQHIGGEYQIDVALMPVTTYRIPMTMNEKGAVKAARTLHPQVIIPIHLGIEPRAFFLRTADSPEHFTQRLENEKLPVRVVQLKAGESYTL